MNGISEARDAIFWDLHTLLMSGGRTLRHALDTYARKYASEDVGHVVRSLAYFTDAEAEPMPHALTPTHWQRITTDFAAWVRAL